MAKKKQIEKPLHFCRECQRITHTYSKKPDGVTDILGFCDIENVYKLLDHEWCDKFKMK